MKDLMIDIETAGELPNSKILTVGAVFFDRNSGRLGKEFYMRASHTLGINGKRISTKATQYWWEHKAPDEAREEAFGGEELLEVVLIKFKRWVRDNCSLTKVRPWGNGSTFDEVLLENAYRMLANPEKSGYSIAPPWRFYNIRDVRTALDMAKIKKSSIPFEGVEHHALDDAKHEARLVIASVQKVGIR